MPSISNFVFTVNYTFVAAFVHWFRGIQYAGYKTKSLGSSTSEGVVLILIYR